MGAFVADMKKIRERAKQHMSDGAVTAANKANSQEVVKVLNEVLATEIVCTLRYKRHYYTAEGLYSDSVKAEFLEHAADEQAHADSIAMRIVQLNGKPDFNPASLAERSHSDYDDSDDLVKMIEEDLVAERIAIETYSEIARWLGERDSTSRRLIEGILEKEEEHAEDLASLIARLPTERKGGEKPKAAE
jgi:bacterioferritin